MPSLSYNHEKPNYLLIALIVIVACLAVYVCLIKNPKLLLQTPLVEGLNKYEKKYDLVTTYNPAPDLKTQRNNNLNQFVVGKSHAYTAEKDISVDFPYPESWNLSSKDDYQLDFSENNLIVTNKDKNNLYITNLNSLESWQLKDKDSPSNDPVYATKSSLLFWISNKDKLNLYDISKNQLIWSRLLADKKIQKMHITADNNLALVNQNEKSTYIQIFNYQTGEIQTTVDLKSKDTVLQLIDDKNNLYVYCEDAFYKLNKENGKILWTAPSYASISNNMLAGKTSIFLATSAGQFISISKKTGEKNWEYNAEQPFSGKITLIPIYNRVAAMTDEGYIHSLDAFSGELRWKLKLKKESPNSDLKSAKLNSQLIMKFSLPWKFKAWSLWSHCAKRSICILNPADGQVLAKYTNSLPVATLPHFIKDRFVIIGQTDKDLSKTKLHYYVNQ